MAQDPSPTPFTRQQTLVHVFVLLALCLILLFLFINKRPLWDVDEGMHAATAKDMILTGDWITPRFNGEAFYDKPPLFNWLTAVSFLLFGFNEFAARFPTALFGLGCVLVTYFFGRRMAGPRAGLMAGVILAANPEFIVLSRAVVHDMTLAFFTTSCLYCFYSGVHEESRRKTYFITAYAAAGLAVLTKGPLGLLLPAMVAGIYLISSARLALIKSMINGWGIALFLLIAAPWYVLIIHRDTGYASYFFIQQNLMNFVSSQEARHPQPFYYYVPALLGGFFPWSLILPPALVQAWVTWRRASDDSALFLLAWCGSIFVFFSIAQSKLPPYVLPLFPGVAILAALFWDDLIRSWKREQARQLFIASASLVVILAAALLYVQIWPPLRVQANFGVDMSRITWLLILLIGFAAAGITFAYRGHIRSAFSAQVGMVAVGTLYVIVTIVPMISPYRSTKSMAKDLDHLTTAKQPLAFYRRIMDSALFYTNREGRVIRGGKPLTNFLNSDPDAFCLIEKKRFRKLNDSQKQAIRVVAERANKLIVASISSDRQKSVVTLGRSGRWTQATMK